MKRNFNTRIQRLEEITRCRRERPRVFLWRVGAQTEEQLLAALSPEEKARAIIFAFDIGEEDMKKDIPGNLLVLSTEDLKKRLDQEIRDCIEECRQEGVSETQINSLLKFNNTSPNRPPEPVSGHISEAITIDSTIPQEAIPEPEPPGPGAEEDEPEGMGAEINSLLGRKRKRWDVNQR